MQMGLIIRRSTCVYIIWTVLSVFISILQYFWQMEMYTVFTIFCTWKWYSYVLLHSHGYIHI